MLKEFKKDGDKTFKRKVFSALVGTGLIIISSFVLHMARNSATEKMIKQYDKVKSEERWLSGYNARKYKDILHLVVQPIPLSKVEEVRNEKINLFQENHLVIKHVQNEQPNNIDPKDQLHYVESTVQVAGSWENISNSLQKFNRKYLTSVSSVNMERAEEAGMIKAEIKYRIYYI